LTTTQHHPFIRLLGVICYVTAVLYLVELFFPSEALTFFYSITAMFLLTNTLFFLSAINRIIVFSLLLAGTICFIRADSGLYTAILGFGENINLLSLFLLIPIIGTFMSTAGYLTTLKAKIQARNEKSAQHPYRLSYVLTATIGIILNFGSMAIVKRIADESFSGYRNQKLTLTIMRAFGTSMLWSPYFVNVGLILILFDLSWFDIGGYGLLLACIYIIISVIMFKYISFDEDTAVERKTNEVHATKQISLLPFITFCLILISLSFVLDFLLDVKMLTVVSLLAVVFPFIWALCTGIFKSLTQDVSEQVQSSFVRLKNELAVFISAGYLGMAMSLTDIGTLLSTILFKASLGSVFLLSLFLIILVTLLGQIGLHPVIIVIGIGSSLTPAKFGVSAEYLALVLLLAWTVSTQLSPFSGQVLMASKLMGKSTSVIVKQNLLFVIIMGMVLTTTLYSFYLFGWL
jgi:hypothetical protein